MGSATYYICITFLVLNSFPIILSYCGSETQNQSITDSYTIESVIYNGLINECGCNNKNIICIRKCCGLNYIMNNQTCVFGNSSKFKKPIVYKSDDPMEQDSVKIRYVPGMVKCVIDGQENFKQFLPEHNSEDGGNIQSDGKLWMFSSNIFFDHDDYCMDYSEEFGLIYSVCFNYTLSHLSVGSHLNLIGISISLPFFLVTLIVYALLPERNLYAKSLMCHVFAIFVAFFVSVILIINRGNWSLVTCRAMLMTISCCFMASIFWVNIMAFDICATFSGLRGYSPNKKQEESRRFVIYNIYAWGVPLLFIAFIFILSHTVKPNTWYDPGVRGQQCIIKEGYPMLLYYYGPLAILILSNIIMFIITAWKIRKTQKDTAMLTERGRKRYSVKVEDPDKQMFQLYIRLLFAMGINWSMEIISWAVNWQVKNVPSAVWYLSDFCNVAYGVVVFVLFVCKKDIWKALKKRYYEVVGREPIIETTGATFLTTE